MDWGLLIFLGSRLCHHARVIENPSVTAFRWYKEEANRETSGGFVLTTQDAKTISSVVSSFPPLPFSSLPP